jgi:MFS family permease
MGFVSMFMDISSEMVHSLLPVFLVTALGSSAIAVGVIEGVAEAAAMITKAFSGALSDWLGKRKALAVAGYGLAALTKPLFAMATGTGLIFSARILDRFGKGIRGAPRDALVADITHADSRGAAYGLRQTLDSLGACLGPLIALLLMVMWAGNFRIVFWAATVPAFVAVAVLVVAVREPEKPTAQDAPNPMRFHDMLKLGKSFWLVVGFGFVFNLARFSEAFLLLRAQGVGLSPSMVPVILMVMNIVYSLSAYPLGRLSDRIGRNGLLTAGLAVLIVSNLALAFAVSGYHVAVGAALWGLHLGFTQGLFAAMVADKAPDRFRGTAFGIFHLISGLALLAASLMAGGLWEQFGAPTTFFAGAAIAAVVFMGNLSFRKYL